MTYEYKWYIIKLKYGSQHDIRELVNSNNIYFKEVFVPYQVIYGLKSEEKEELSEIYIHMCLCNESKAMLSEISDDDEPKLVEDDQVTLKRKELVKYKWYILRVASNYEEKVHQYILESSIRLGVNKYFREVFIPYEKSNEMEIKLKKVAPRRKCFPGYIFLYIDLCDELLNFVSNIPKSLKVYGFLKDGNVPRVISSNEINSMCSALYNVQENKKLSYGYEKGEKVKINDGLFQNFTGTIESVNDEEKIVSIEVSILGKPTVIDFDINQVEKIED
ncbi:MAG: transcription termination/antitermination protein NusG [Wolbachia endosymbiont of Fragariocoptes setiger]|nr:transcription termination/antitermination protein NusG [Wolbachia endosymbiont of Fragariocoptes setiger]